MAMFHELTPKDFKYKLDIYDDTVLIDVRTPDEINQQSLDGYLAMDIADPTFTMKVDELDRSVQGGEAKEKLAELKASLAASEE